MKKVNESEKLIRHIMCIFVALETLFLCFVILFISFNDTRIIEIKYHVITFEDLIDRYIIPSTVFCTVIILSAIPALICRIGYLFYEGIHVFIGVIGLLLLFHEDAGYGLIIFIIFSARFIVYKIILSRVSPCDDGEESDNNEIS